MKPVDGDEVLGQRVRHAVVVGHRLRDAHGCLAVEQPDAQPAQPVVGRRAAPVGLETDVDGLGPEDRRCPLDRVDLRDQGGDDQTCRLIDPLVAQARIVRAELVAQEVVLAREERVQAAEPEPPALVETGDLLPVEVLRQVSLGSHSQLRALPQLAGLVRVGPVDLGAVPPGRRLVARRPAPWGSAGRRNRGRSRRSASRAPGRRPACSTRSCHRAAAPRRRPRRACDEGGRPSRAPGTGSRRPRADSATVPAGTARGRAAAGSRRPGSARRTDPAGSAV